jgi:uncharacterized damage-inducible protein DinB
LTAAMTEWTAPERHDAPYVADERTMLEGWLDFHRDTLLTKCAGLTGEQLCERASPPSTLSLLGLLRHMAEVERGWFVNEWHREIGEIYCTPDDPEADFERTDPEQADVDLAIFLREVSAARAEAARHELDDTAPSLNRDGTPRDVSVRWVYVHMIEEYARHNGHADLLRERIDGATGD